MSNNLANIGGFFKKLWSTWFVENTSNSSLDVSDNVYHNGNIGVGDFSGQNINDNLVVKTDGGAGITISNTGAGQTSPFLTFDNPDNPNETVLTPRDGSVLNIEYPESTQYFAIDENGQVQADFYGNGVLTGVPTFDIQVDSAGNFIEVPIVDNDTNITNVTISLSPTNILTTSVTEDSVVLSDTQDLSGIDTNAWFTNGSTTNPDNTRTNSIHHNGDVHVGDGTASSAIILSSANSVATEPDIKFYVQGLIQSESNQFYHSQTGNHQFIGGNVNGTTGSTPLVDFNQNGEVEFNQYGSGTFSGTPAFNLQVDTNGNVIETAVPITPTLNVVKEDIIVGFASGYQDFNTTIQSRNCIINRNSAGIYTIVFNSAHPDGANYEILFGQMEDGNRDVPKVSVVEGTQSPTGFQVVVTVDDNGGTADTLSNDNQFYFEALRTISVVTDVTLL